MSRQITGTLKKPDGTALASTTFTLVALRNESIAVVKESRYSFTTSGTGTYNETLQNGLYAVLLTQGASEIRIGNIVVETGTATTLETLLSVNGSAADPVDAALLQLVVDAQTAEVNAAASAGAAATSEGNAGGSSTKAGQWAEHPDNTDIPGEAVGTRSAKHHANAGSASAAAAATSEGNAGSSSTKAGQWAEHPDNTDIPGEAVGTRSAKHHANAGSASAAAAATSESNAGSSSTKAGQWAEHPDNTDIPGEAVGTRSAKHHANAGSASAAAAATSESNAGSSSTKAQDWAETAEDVVVPGEVGMYSALHHAAKAAASASSIANGLVFKGGHDASLGAAPPTPAGDPNESADFYKITVAGTINSIVYAVNDNIVWDTVNNAWFKIDNTESVASVAGKQGEVTLVKADVGLGNVDNTSDANKPVSTAQQAALDGKEPTFTKNTAFNKNFGTSAGTASEGDHSHTKAAVGLGNVDNTADTAKPVSTAQQTALNGKENSFSKNSAFNKNFGTSAGTTSEGNHSHTKAAIGLGNVDNTSDSAKPVSSAQQTALDGKANTSLSNLDAAGNDRLVAAWVRWDSSGTFIINDSYNVSSITDNGVGDFTINFATALPNSSFAAAGSASNLGIASTDSFVCPYALATTYVKVGSNNNNGTLVDRDFNSVIVAASG